MRNRSSMGKQPDEVNPGDFRSVQRDEEGNPTEQPRMEKNPAAVTLGRLGGIKGGKARAEKLNPEERRTIAKLAAIARWSKPRNERG